MVAADPSSSWTNIPRPVAATSCHDVYTSTTHLPPQLISNQIIKHTYSKMSEGTIPYNVPGIPTPCSTWYRTVGDISDPSKTPLVLLHGGPGACHEYLLPFTDLSVPLIFYDQVGNGRSTHFREKKGDTAFWQPPMFLAELDNLLAHFGLDEASGRRVDILGQSWGGMLGALWATEKPRPHLRKLILCNSTAESALWTKGVDMAITELPQEAQDAVAEARRTREWETPGMVAAGGMFIEKFMSTSRPCPPKEVMPAFAWIQMDNSAHSTMYVAENMLLLLQGSSRNTRLLILIRYGPSLVSNTGTLENFNVTADLHKIKAKTLLLTGKAEGPTALGSKPFADHIENCEWITIDDAGHFSHVDQREKTMKIVQDFLDRDD